jgi:shikimate kinase
MVIIVWGVAGSGKTSIGKAFAGGISLAALAMADQKVVALPLANWRKRDSTY